MKFPIHEWNNKSLKSMAGLETNFFSHQSGGLVEIKIYQSAKKTASPQTKKRLIF